MSDLRACPFCGSKGIIVGKDPSCVERYQWRVMCFGCMTVGPMMPDEIKARIAWNKREPDYEQKWGELVETVASRIAEDEKRKAGK